MSEEKGLSLYAMTAEMRELLEAEEVDGELIERAFGNITDKGSRVCYFLRDLDAAAAMHKDEEKRLADRRRALENKSKRIKEYLQLCMEQLEVDALDAGTFKLRIQANPAALEITNEEEIPDAYRIIIPQRTEPDKERIKSDLKAGKDVPGARLTHGRSLRIR